MIFAGLFQLGIFCGSTKAFGGALCHAGLVGQSRGTQLDAGRPPALIPRVGNYVQPLQRDLGNKAPVVFSVIPKKILLVFNR